MEENLPSEPAPRVELRAVALAEQHFLADGYSVEDVSRKRGHNGYDLLVEKDGTPMKVEVKGATRAWGIPDPYNTEFDDSMRLVADVLCVVYFIGNDPPKMCLIPRDAISPKDVSVRMGYRISSRFKKESVLSQYVVPIRA
ncbi:hypothetical protein [Polaromonas sp.]|uniref:hypothetical protein n=1 Tax=Polaromonas sp. TaxID=1869339 RepID=UPI0035644A4A